MFQGPSAVSRCITSTGFFIGGILLLSDLLVTMTSFGPFACGQVCRVAGRVGMMAFHDLSRGLYSDWADRSRGAMSDR